jgi:site-specific DNA-methyltransferase (adenine-specific)
MQTDRIYTGDCLDILSKFSSGCAHLISADEPFNIGLPYPDHDDSLPEPEYLDGLRSRFRAYRRVLAPSGSLVVFIDPKHLPPVGVMLAELGFHWRNTIVWHYNFGRAQETKLTPSWTALLHVVKDLAYCKFRGADPDLRIPSARQTTYNDGRANPEGKVLPDVWSDIPRLTANHPEWCGYPTQLPLALTDRVIRLFSDPGDLVLDPMCGTGTSLLSAKRLGRHWLGIDKSPVAVAIAERRLSNECVPLFAS